MGGSGGKGVQSKQSLEMEVLRTLYSKSAVLNLV